MGLDGFFTPRSVAVIGASPRSGLLSRPLRYLSEFGYAGGVYPVNPRYQEINGLPCYPSIDAVPGPVDLALLQVPAAATQAVVGDCAAAGVRSVIVLASGYAEVGADGRVLQEDLARLARETGVRVIGPNCQGTLYAPAKLAATFTAGADGGFDARAASTGLAYIGQSGAVGGSVLGLARERRQPLTAWVSTGNQADVTFVEATRYLLADDHIRVCMGYVEDVGDAAARADYADLAREAAARGKSLVVLRSGRSDVGRRAVAAHTGTLVPADDDFEEVSRRHGVVVAHDVDELLECGIALAQGRRYGSGRVGVVTSSGGAGSLFADHLRALGLEVPEIGMDGQRRLAEIVPGFGAVANPVDVTAQLFQADTARFSEVCRLVAGEPEVDVVGVVLTMVTGDAADAVAAGLFEVAGGLDKPLAVAWIAGEAQTRTARAALNAAGINVFPSVGALARLIARLSGAGARPPVPPQRPGGALAESESER
ncbi:MAG: hypothetical protein GEV11_13820 [Streptosporangiales bacterium]|nr:hypothetical protein [Streptosporangiales bacterium]